MSASPGADARPQPAAPSPGAEPVRPGQWLGIAALVVVVLGMLLLVFGPMFAVLFGYSGPAYGLLNVLLPVSLLLTLGAIGLGIGAVITRRGRGLGLAALIVGGMILLWGIATFFVPLLFGAGR